MDRRTFLKTASSSAAAAAFTPSPGSQPVSPRASRDDLPNFIFVFTDDQRWDALGCAGNQIIHTPEMDRLAREGVRFRRAFVTSPICAASRASALTGTYERTHGFTFGTPPLGGEFTDMSYPHLLHTNGYRTGFVGKWGMQVEGGVTAELFDTYDPLSRNPYVKSTDEGKRHLTQIITDRAIDFLEGSGDRPFCLSVSYHAPHAEDLDPLQYYWPEHCDDLYREVTIPPPENGTREFFESQPLFLQHSLNRIRWYWRYNTPEKYQAMVKGYYRMISGIDHGLGRLRRTLAANDLEESTVIVLMGDNGHFLGERGFAGKWLMYEPSIRVPLIVYDPAAPGANQGRVREEFALNVDLAPTMLDMANVSIPQEMQGRSLRPLLRGNSVEWRDDVFCEHLFDHDDIPQSEGIRTDRWKYLRYPQHNNSEELYDLTTDPDEENNLAWRRSYNQVLRGLRGRCDRIIERLEAGEKPG